MIYSFKEILQFHLQEMAKTNPHLSSNSFSNKYNLYKYDYTYNKELAKKVLVEYTKTISGLEIKYKPELTNGRGVISIEDANIFIDEVIARLQKQIKATPEFYKEFKFLYLEWFQSL